MVGTAREEAKQWRRVAKGTVGTEEAGSAEEGRAGKEGGHQGAKAGMDLGHCNLQSTAHRMIENDATGDKNDRSKEKSSLLSTKHVKGYSNSRSIEQLSSSCKLGTLFPRSIHTSDDVCELLALLSIDVRIRTDVGLRADVGLQHRAWASSHDGGSP